MQPPDGSDESELVTHWHETWMGSPINMTRSRQNIKALGLACSALISYEI